MAELREQLKAAAAALAEAKAMPVRTRRVATGMAGTEVVADPASVAAKRQGVEAREAAVTRIRAELLRAEKDVLWLPPPDARLVVGAFGVLSRPVRVSQVLDAQTCLGRVGDVLVKVAVDTRELRLGSELQITNPIWAASEEDFGRYSAFVLEPFERDAYLEKE